MRKRARRLCNTFGITSRANPKPGSHLPFDHPSLERVRLYVTQEASKRGIHERLIGNFDQVWCTDYRPSPKVLGKPATWRNIQKDPLARSKYLRTVRHNIERSLDMTLTEPDPGAKKVKDGPSMPVVTGGPASWATVEAWRSPRTLTTLSFVDGWVGRAFITFRQGDISDASRDKLNQELGRYIHISQGQARSHIWNESTLMVYLDFLAEELRLRRRQLNLDRSARALIMMDQAGAHMSQTYKRLQENWASQHNVEALLEKS